MVANQRLNSENYFFNLLTFKIHYKKKEVKEELNTMFFF